MGKISPWFFAMGAILSGGASAYTLVITSCNHIHSGTSDTLTLGFCAGGSYCPVTDTMNAPKDSGVDEVDTPVEITVSFGYVPTTMEISNPDGTDAWCIAKVEWESDDNIMGQNASIWLDSQTGALGCVDGVNSEDNGACLQTWRFFNLDSASDYVYNVNVKACSSTKSVSVQASFCSTYVCDGTDEEEAVMLTLGDEEGGWTTTDVSLSFNPIGMRLEEVDETWCADEILFNGFIVLTESVSAADFEDVVDSTPSKIVHNIQTNGVLPQTPSPVTSVEGEDEDKVLDATWEIAVTVVGAILGAIGAAIATRIVRKWSARRSEESTDGDVGVSGRQPTVSDVPRTRTHSINQPPSYIESCGDSSGWHRREGGAMEAPQDRPPPPFDFAEKHH